MSWRTSPPFYEQFVIDRSGVIRRDPSTGEVSPCSGPINLDWNRFSRMGIQVLAHERQIMAEYNSSATYIEKSQPFEASPGKLNQWTLEISDEMIQVVREKLAEKPETAQ